MEKFLLTVAAAALTAGSMMAEDVTLSVTAATDIEGTLVEATSSAGAHYQPLTSLKIGDFSFTFKAGADALDSQNPAFYHTNATPSIRLYKGAEMTIAFPAGVEVGSITWTLDKIAGVDNITCSNGEAAVNIEEKIIVWNNSAKAAEVTFTLPSAKGSDGKNPNVQIASFEVSAEGTVIVPDPIDPVDPTPSEIYSGLTTSCDWAFENTVIPEDLTYIWTWDEKYSYLKGSAYKNQSYASEAWAISPVIDLATAADPYVTFLHCVGPKNTAEANLEYFRTNCGIYVREQGGEWSQLAISEWPVADWQWVNAGELSLKDFAGKKIELGAKYVSTDEITVTWEIKELKVADMNNNAVELVNAENAAPVYFDLNGRRVAEPANGLFIKVQGNKVSKVIVK